MPHSWYKSRGGTLLDRYLCYFPIPIDPDGRASQHLNELQRVHTRIARIAQTDD